MSKKTTKTSNIKSNNTFLDLINENNKDLTMEIEKLFKKIKKNDEFEFIFFSKKDKYLSQEQYINLLKFYQNKTTDDNFIQPTETLDISLQGENDITYRCSIEGKQNMNVIMQKLCSYSNHVIFKQLLKMSDKYKYISFMKKIKEKTNTIDIDDLDIRIRLSHENELTQDDINFIINIDNTYINKIFYRLKQRTSCIIHSDKNKGEYIRTDMTATLSTNKYSNLNTSIPNYEIEIEYMTENSDNLNNLDIIYKEAELLLKIVKQSNYLLTNTQTIKVIKEYENILSIDKQKTLNGRNAISLEINHVTSTLPDRYAVSDKADGDRNFLIIYDSKVYLLSKNLNVKYTGIQLDASLNEYNGTIMDGEYIFINTNNRHVFLCFDCLTFGNKDLRKIPNLFERFKYADIVINNCFIFENHVGKSNLLELDNFNLNKYVTMYYNDIQKYMDNFNKDIKEHKNFPLIRRKYFIGCTGGKSWEIFAYALMLWNAYTKDKKIKCPYELDGLIFQPLEQPYTTNVKETKYFDFKMKPFNKNSIDFYVEYERDPNTSKVLIAYDNSNDDEYIKNKSYKILNLYVGCVANNVEKPILFKKEEQLYIANIFLENNEARDIYGDIIADKTVVEFYYNNNPEIQQNFRWVPIKTRHDKTETVKRFGRFYGNNYMIANKIWRTIINPITFEDFEDLEKGNIPEKGLFTYDKKMDSLRKRIDKETIISTNRENLYFQKTSNIAKEMREFHNWMKSNMIYSICNDVYRKKTVVLDLAFGRGADINKYYYARVEYLVAVDLDKDVIFSVNNGAVSRYNGLKRSKPDFPKMYFIHGDVGAILNVPEQQRALGYTGNENEHLINKFFPIDKKPMFDRVVCNFAIHYLLKNETTWNNFKENVNTNLKDGGYFLVTTFDGQKVANLLKDKEKYTAYYTDQKGNKMILYDIVKKYDEPKEDIIYGVGNAIDIYLSWFMEEGNYYTEYLVDKRFLEKELLESCNLELVDTDDFENQMNIQKNFLNKYSQYENVKATNQFFGKVKKFYEKNETNLELHVYNNLMRYYVFRKKDVHLETQKVNNIKDIKDIRDIKNNKTKNNKKNNTKQKGGDLIELNTDEIINYNFNNTKEFYIPNMKKYIAEHSFLNAVYHLVKSHDIIPKNTTMKEFFEDFNIPLYNDTQLNEKSIRQIGGSLIIDHDIENKKKTVINGLNMFVIEQDCNGFYEIDLHSKQNKIDPSDKYIVLKKEEGHYYPLYHIVNDKKKGVFKMSDNLIKWMFDNLD
jgi:hypothetical protein